MYIISKFRDYYDSAMGMGVDKSLIYKRTNEAGTAFQNDLRWNFGANVENHRVLINGRHEKISVTTWIVPMIFCGKLYRRGFAEVKYPNPEYGMYPAELTERFVSWSRSSALERAYEAHGLSEKTEVVPKYRHYQMRDLGQTFGNWADAQDWAPVHIEEGCPVFLIRGLTREEQLERPRNMNLIIERNPCLKDYGFYQVKDAYTAFQEIAMYLGGVMGTEGRPMVQLNDKELHQKHGFDKWSFRKMPEHR